MAQITVMEMLPMVVLVVEQLVIVALREQAQQVKETMVD
jgi:hypothetical protein